MLNAGDLGLKYDAHLPIFMVFWAPLNITTDSIFIMPFPLFLNALSTCNARDRKNRFLFTVWLKPKLRYCTP